MEKYEIKNRLKNKELKKLWFLNKYGKKYGYF